MKIDRQFPYTLLCVLWVFLSLPHSVKAQWVTQQVTLYPGWNAVYLEVSPQPADCDLVFVGTPVESVWEWNRQSSPVQFIEDPAKLVPRNPQWSTWFPANSSSRFLGNLFDLVGGQAYLIKLGGSTSVSIQMKGVPVRPRAQWVPDAFGLTGFHVSTTGAPTFSSYFAASQAHTGQQVFRLDSQGKWVLTPQSTAIQRGKAYWVKTSGGSDYAGPVDVELESRSGIDFGTDLDEAELVINNRTTAAARTVNIELAASDPRPSGADAYPIVAGPVVLYYRDSADVTAEEPLGIWKQLSGVLPVSVAAGGHRTIRLSARRASMPGSGIGGGSVYQGVLRLTESGGTRQEIPVKAGSNREARGGSPRGGLWVGTATLNRVSWAVASRKLVAAAYGDDRFQQYKDPSGIDFEKAGTLQNVVPPAGLAPDATLPTGSEFVFRVIMHVDGSGNTRLLQRVIQVWENGSNSADSGTPGAYLPVTPGRFRLFSNETAAGAFVGSTIRAGVQVPRRLSTVAYPLNSPLVLTGNFGAGVMSGSMVMGYDDPLNPFVHQYHPQHDNRNARFEDQKLAPGNESYNISRMVRFEFAAERPGGRSSPVWGESELGGVYKESINGLHRNTLHVAGTFLLKRVSGVEQID